MPITKYTAVLAVIIAALAAPVQAYEQGDWIIRVGAANVDPDTESDEIDVAGLATLDGVDVDDDTQLGITATYMLTDIWAVELLAASPFEHDITVKGAPVDAGSTKHLPPTLTFMWYPMGGKDSSFQPYVGAGINYTYFWDEEVDSELEEALGGIIGSTDPVPADLDLDDSWGFAARAGFDYLFNENWGFNASVWWIDIETEATIETAVADVEFDVELDPWVYMVGISYRF
jgi:outer membrane protein